MESGTSLGHPPRARVALTRTLSCSQKCTACTKTKNRVHGAPIQCTKGKCPKAFHVSCARDGHASGIVYKVVKEVEKEVVLLDSQTLAQAPPPRPPPPILLLHPDVAQIQASIASAPMQGIEHSGPIEVDSDVAPAPPDPVTVERQASPSPRVLKTIRKTEVEVLCHQHNPVCLFLGRRGGEVLLLNALTRRSSQRRRPNNRTGSATLFWPCLPCRASSCA